MKGIILAGGTGTRLYPVTQVVSKQLMPVYDKPMIYYPLSTLMLAGIREILIITTPHDQAQYKALLGDGTQWGLRLEYCVQERPEGVAQALILGEQFLDGGPCTLILGDNLFYGEGLPAMIKKGIQTNQGATIFGYYVSDPQAYGVIEFDAEGKVVSLEEKPKQPKSHFAVPGIYIFNGSASQYAREQAPSPRGELEITDLNLRYLAEGQLHAVQLGRGIAWLDTGTHKTLLQAANFIRTIIERQGLQIGSPEEVAYRAGWISKAELLALCQKYGKNDYGSYLTSL
ncbi:MAG: glucose-1-phosphate thymidylyltransferase RfbA [bacterium]|nr:glucose-1-phosphate thymidylyltransferase RfbA [bacterium]